MSVRETYDRKTAGKLGDMRTPSDGTVDSRWATIKTPITEAVEPNLGLLEPGRWKVLFGQEYKEIIRDAMPQEQKVCRKQPEQVVKFCESKICKKAKYAEERKEHVKSSMLQKLNKWALTEKLEKCTAVFKKRNKVFRQGLRHKW